MKIGFIGAGGTGKTTVATALAEKLGLNYHQSVPRSVFQARGLTEADQRSMTPAQIWDLQKAIFEAKIEQDEVYRSGVFDRTLLDHLAYCIYRCADSIPAKEMEKMQEAMYDNIRSYTLLAYFPLFNWGGSADGFREDKFSYQVAIDTIMNGLLHLYGVKYVSMRDEVPEDRIKFLWEGLR